MRIGLALGGGGVRGLAHIPALETIDACGVQPTHIAGTSMGAIIGAFYASGWSGSRIRDFMKQHIIEQDDNWKTLYPKSRGIFRWIRKVGISFKGQGLVKIDGLLKYLIESIEVDTFEELATPLKVVATDFHSGQPVIFESGPLFPALKASISIPGVFMPVKHDGRILVDGGVTNNLPYDLLTEICKRTIAVDVIPTPTASCADMPNMMDATLGMLDRMMAQFVEIKLAQKPPTIYLRPRLTDIRVLDFHKSDEVLKQAGPAMRDFRKQLQSIS